MKPAPFDLLRPDSLDDALDALGSSEGEAKPLAGGQSLVPLMALRLATPTTLVDLNRVSQLTGVTSAGAGRVGFGAMTRHSALVDSAEHPLVGEAARWIGHTAIRTRGTIGGSLAHADPSAELPSIAVACDAAIVLRSVGATRAVAARDFFTGTFETVLGDDELLTSVELAQPRRWGFAEFARRDGDFALVLAVVAELDDGWRVVIGGVGATPWRCRAAEAVLAEAGVSGRVREAVAEAVADTVETFDDVHADATYRRAMAAHFASQAVVDALGTGAGV